MKNKCSNDKGFTLIELMVVIAITVLISGAVFANMQMGRRSMDVNASAEKIAEILKQAQMMALTGKTIDDVRPDYGYGVYFDTSTDPDSYILFINDFDETNYQYDDGSDTLIQRFTLPENVNFDSVPHSSMVFKPPYGEIWISAGAGGCQFGQPSCFGGSDTSLLLIKHDDANFYGYVRVNSEGEIDVRTSP